jgi:antitoxin component YwqK of YwqJK toxin-antitoxin module
MQKILFLALGLVCNVLMLFAQKEIKIADVQIINDGEGRLYCFNRADESPVDGQVRLIDGYRSQYIETEFKAGYASGTWKSYDNNVMISEGIYREGYRDGAYKEYYPDGKIKVQRSFVAGKIDGKAVTYYPDGKTETEKEYAKGVEHGIDRRYDRDGNITADSRYKDGRPEGKSIRRITSNAGDYTTEANHKDGLPDGEYTETFTDGSIKTKGRYAGGKKTGRWEYNRADGYKQPSELYDNTGDLVGRITWYTNGNMDEERQMKNGKNDGVTRKYFPDGKLKSEVNYKNGREDGPSARYITSNTGIFKETCHYTNGRRNGEYTEEYENGRLRAKGQYANGSKTGKWTYYNEDGSIKREETL